MLSSSLIILTLGMLAMDASAQPETIYMSVLNSRKHRLNASDNPTVGLFLSTDAGVTWQHRGWREYIRTFYTESDSRGVIWSACGNGVLRSSDGGNRWVITTGWRITEVLRLDVDPSDDGTIYAATAYGIFKSTNDGAEWVYQKLDLALPFTSDVLVDRSNAARVFAATENGVYLSTNRGRTWGQAGLGGQGTRVLVQDPLDEKVFWVGTEEQGVFRSQDRGNTWSPMNSGLRHPTVYSITIDPENPSMIYLGTHGGGVYRTSDRGERWEAKSKGLANPDVHSVLVLRTDPSIVLAGTLNGGLFRSTDKGETWHFNSQEGGQVWGLSAQ